MISIQLHQTIKKDLDVIVDKVTFWTDSTSVLKCLKNEAKRFQTFESNRLTTIRNGSSVSKWRYVKSEDNPAEVNDNDSEVRKETRIYATAHC